MSVSRAAFEEIITKNGGSIAKSVTKAVTHLVSSETGTKKCQEAEAKGISIVDEQWVRDKISGSGTTSATKKAAKGKAKPEPEATVETVKTAASGKNLAGMTICITGTLSQPRAAFEKMLTSNGASIAKTVTKAVTHLVSSESGTKKCQDAEAKGVKIVDEAWILSCIAGSSADDTNNSADGENEDTGSWFGKAKAHLSEKATTQQAEAKEHDWSYDPRPAIDVNNVSLALVLTVASTDSSALTQVVDGVTEKVLSQLKGKGKGKPSSKRVIDHLLNQIKSDLSLSTSDYKQKALDEKQLCAFAIYRWIQSINCTSASFVQDIVKQEADDDSEGFAKALIPILVNELFQDGESSVRSEFSVEPVPAVEPDPLDEDRSWCERFNAHMIWLFSILDGNQCNTLARIKTCLGDKTKEDMFEKLHRSALEEFEDDPDASTAEEGNRDNFIQWIRHKYAKNVSPRYLNKLTELQIRHLATYELLTTKVDVRTYLGTFMFGIRESDYDGCRSGIADYAGSAAEDFDDIYGFLQCLVLDCNAEEMNDRITMPNTAAFYVPGMKHNLWGDDEDEVHEDDDEE